MPVTSRPRVRPRAPATPRCRSPPLVPTRSPRAAPALAPAHSRPPTVSDVKGAATTMAAGASAASVADAAGASAAAIAATAATTLLTRAGLAPNAAPPPENSPSRACWASRTFLNARRLSRGASRSSTATTSLAIGADGDRPSRSCTSGSRPRRRCGYSSSSMGRPSRTARPSRPAWAKSVCMSNRTVPAAGGVGTRHSRHNW